MVKFLIGGSPCTFWSIAQKNNRETTAEGLGWELFKNYLIAKEKFKPDIFFYENNKSAAKVIKDQIKKGLKVWDGIGEDSGARYIEINSALVSAQNRQRFYVHNCGEVGQPEDRHIYLKDILETGIGLSGNEKSYCLTARYDGAIPWNTLERKQREIVAERIPEYGKPDKSRPCEALYPNHAGTSEGSLEKRLCSDNPNKQQVDLIAEPISSIKVGAFQATQINKVYEVKDGKITIKGKQYPIKLKDGYYIIRKLTVTECCRLQGMPEWWFRDNQGNKILSDSQAYKGLGNGWQLDTVKYIWEHRLKNIPKDEEIVVLSMYDGIATGRRILEELGFTNVKYYAYEIDKNCIKLTSYRYPDIIHCGDAFRIRRLDWTIGF